MMILRRNGHIRLAPMLALLAAAAILLGGLASAAFGAFKSASDTPRPQLEPYPKLSEQQVEGISGLFDPQLPFNESVVTDAFLDRAKLGDAETAAAFSAPVVKTVGPAPTGYGTQPFIPSGPAAAPAQVTQQTDNEEAQKKSRIEAARRSGKLGTKDEASVYNWRDVVPLGVVGFQGKDGTQVREVALMNILTRRYFTARRGTMFADSTLSDVTSTGVIFSDATGNHEVGWSRKTSSVGQSQNQTPNIVGRETPRQPSGYADTAQTPSNARRQP